MKIHATFSEATDAFIEAAYWLTDEDGPLITLMLNAAASLDQGIRATMLGEFRQAYVLLRRRAPETEDTADDLDRFLETL